MVRGVVNIPHGKEGNYRKLILINLKHNIDRIWNS